MGGAGSVCHRLCRQTVAQGIRESKRKTFRAQTVKAQIVNNCCFAGVAGVNQMRPKDMDDCNLYTCACLSRADTLPWAKVHSSAVVIKFCMYVLIYNIKATIVKNFIWIRLGVFEIHCKTKRSVLSEHSAFQKLLSGQTHTHRPNALPGPLKWSIISVHNACMDEMSVHWHISIVSFIKWEGNNGGSRLCRQWGSGARSLLGGAGA